MKDGTTFPLNPKRAALVYQSDMIITLQGVDMKIGIIGAGNIGQAIARLAVANGHTATLSNSRGPNTIRDLAEQIGCDVDTSEKASKLSDIVILSVPFNAAFRVASDLLNERVVIDTNNYYPDRDGRIADLDDRLTTTSEMIASHFKGATIVKAFNAVLALDLEKPVRIGQGRTRALPIAGNDVASKALVTSLQSDFRFDTVDAGGLADSWRFERAKPAYCIPLDQQGLTEALAVARRDKELPEGSWRR